MAMRFLTDRKLAEHLGPARSGTEHHWAVKVSSVALLVLVPLFVTLVGPLIGQPHAEVRAALARPLTALIAGLTLIVGMAHFKDGARTLIEDYARGSARLWLQIMVILVAWGTAATGLFALGRLAF